MRGADEHLEADIVFVPSGLLVVGRCRKCGGRAERLAALDPEGIPVPTNGNGSGVANGEPAAGLESALEQVFAELAEGHQKCAKSPRGHSPKPLMSQLVDRALADARRGLAHEGAVGGMLYLLMDDGRACAVGVEQLIGGATAPSVERTANRAGSVEAVRQYLRALNLRPSAAIVVTEAWASPLEGYETRRSGEGPRDEVVVASLVTRRFGRVGWADVTRASGKPEVGPGEFGELAWGPLTESAPVTDGIFAHVTKSP